MISFRALIVSTCVGLAAVFGAPGEAAADPVSSTGKGTAGLALLGGEAVLMTEAALGIEPTWAYIVGGSVGTIGGGAAGYFLEDSFSPKVSMYMLTAGMALIIPTTIVTLNATSYNSPEGLTEDTGVQSRPTTGLPAPVARAPRLSRPRLAPALVGYDTGAVNLGVPGLALVPVFSDQEVASLGVRQQTEFRFSLVNALF